MAGTTGGRPAVERTIPPKAMVRFGNPIYWVAVVISAAQARRRDLMLLLFGVARAVADTQQSRAAKTSTGIWAP
jgi:hypothetical protein